MSDLHTFSRTFLSGGVPVEVDPDLSALLRDSYGRPALEVTLADGRISLNPETLCYSFAADLAWLVRGAVSVVWSAKLAGIPVQGSPIVELRPRIAAYARHFGATVPDVLEKMRGLSATDFSPLFSGATGDGEAVLGRFLNSASAMVAAALPQVLFGLLTTMNTVLCESAPSGITHFALPVCGGEISAVALFFNGSDLPLAPDTYSLDGNVVILATAPTAGTRICATLEYTGMAPALLREHTTMLAAVESCLSLIPAGTDARAKLLEEHRRMGGILGAFRKGELVPTEWHGIPLEGAILPRPGTLSTGRLAEVRNRRTSR